MLETKNHQTIRRRPKKTLAMLFAVVLMVLCMMPSAHAAITMETAGNAANRISVGEVHSLALKADGTVAAWGRNIYHQCNVPSGLTDVVAIAAGRDHSLALKSDGTVVAWGSNLYGQCNVPSGLKDVVDIASGSSTSLALKEDGTVVDWGSDRGGVPSDLSDVVAISAHFNLFLALKSDGTVVAWGWNSHGECNVPSGLKDVVAIAAGESHALALKSDGTVVAWGNEDYSSGISDLTDVVAIAAGSDHSLALKSDGTVVACGGGFYGSDKVPSDISDVVAIAAGQFWSLALKSDGTIVAWGWNSYNQLNVPSGLKLGSRLTDIQINNGALSFDFKPGTFSYALSVPDDYVSIGISPFADDDIQIKVQGATKASGSTTDISLNPGETIVTIDAIEPDTSLTTTYTLTVSLKKAVDSVTLSSNNETMIHHDTLALTATVLPEDATYPDVTWESEDDSVATVDTNGNVKAMGVGSTTVTATADGVSDTCDITVNARLVTGVTLSPESHTLVLGDADTSNDTVTLTTTVTPYNATDPTVSYQSSNTSVATVDESGFVTAVAAGNAIITATTNDGNHTATCDITVEQRVSGVTLSSLSMMLDKGDAVVLAATVSPEDATYPEVTWTSSDTDVATVDSTGKVTAVDAGAATITATAEGKSAACDVTVVIPVSAISLNSSSKTIETGEAYTLVATVNPQDASYPDVTWSSSNSGVATVTQGGVVTAASAGTTTITATADGKSATCEISVKVSVDKVTLNRTAKTVNQGKSFTLSAEVSPANATYSAVTWKSGNINVATVSQNGVVKAIDAGTTIIIATADGVSATCTVKVEIPVIDVSLSSGFEMMYIGDSLKLSAAINPGDATHQNVTWESSDDSVATVSSDGTVEAVGIGEAAITAGIDGKSAECSIRVDMRPTPTVTPTATPLEAEPSSSPTPIATATNVPGDSGITITPGIVKRDDQTGKITIELNIDELPEGTSSIKLPGGEIIYVADSENGIISITVDENELDAAGDLQIIFLDDQEVPFGSVSVKVSKNEGTEKYPSWLLWTIGAIGVSLIAASAALHLRQKKRRNQRMVRR